MDDMRIPKQAFHYTHTMRGRRDIGCTRRRQKAENRRGRFPIP
jgi:hypothetical protein